MGRNRRLAGRPGRGGRVSQSGAAEGLIGGRAFIWLLGALVGIAPFAVDTYLPAFSVIGRDLGTGIEQVQTTLGVFLAGFCIGMLVCGPLSDRYGRRRLLVSGTTLFMLTSIGCAVVAGIEQLIVLRLLQALGGGAASVLARTIVRDVYPPEEAAKVLSLMAIITAIAPLIAPGLGGLILVHAGWRVIFVGLAVYGVLCLLATKALLPETLPPERRNRAGLLAAFLAYGRILKDPYALGYVIAGGAVFGGLFAYITGSPFVYIDYFGVTPEWHGYGALYALNVVSQMLIGWTNSRLVGRIGVPRMVLWGAVACAAASGLLLASASTGALGLAGIALPLLVTVGIITLMGANCIARLMARYPDNAGAAAALFGAAMFGFGGLASFAVSALHDGTPVPMALVVAGSATLSLAARLTLARER